MPVGAEYRCSMRRTVAIHVLVPTLAVTALSSCSNAQSGDGPSVVTAQADSATSTDGTAMDAAAATAFKRTVVARFTQPWALTFLPGTPYLAVTQRDGRLKLRHQTNGRVITVSGTPRVVHAGQGGLGDIITAPGYNGKSNRGVYLSWVEAGRGGTGAVVGRATLVISGSTARLAGLKRIWYQNPKVSGSGHFSHRLAISPDRKYLYVTSGERQKKTQAQNMNNNLGSVVRLTLAGRAAPGNPFYNRPGLTKQIWSYGHRNALGLAFDKAGRLWSSEMGPRGGDELNLIRRGANYGWPKASNGSNYNGSRIPDHRAGDGFVAPKVWWNPSISPSSLMIYSGSMFPAWKGDAFTGGLSGESLIRVDLNGASAKKAQRWKMNRRIREVEQGPDGAIWLLEDAPSGALVRLRPR